MSLDPLQKQYAALTPYQFASNSPIENVDLDGLEEYHYLLLYQRTKDGITAVLKPLETDPISKDGYTILQIFGWQKIPSKHYIVNVEGVYIYSNGTYSLTEGEFDDLRKSNYDASFFDWRTSNEEERDNDAEMINNATILLSHSLSEPSPQTKTNTQVEAANDGNTEASDANNGAQKKLKVGTYRQGRKQTVNTEFTNDHIPSFASLKKREEERLGRNLSAREEYTLKMNSLTLTIKVELHMSASETFGGENTTTRQITDARNPLEAIRNNVNMYRPTLKSEGYSDAEIDEAIKELSVPFLKKKQ